MEENNNLPNLNNQEETTQPVLDDVQHQNGEIELDPVFNYEQPLNNSNMGPKQPFVPQPSEPIAPVMPVITNNEYVKLEDNGASKGIKVFAIIIALLVLFSGAVTGGYLVGKHKGSGSALAPVDLASKPAPEDAMSVAEVYNEVNSSVVGVYAYNKNGKTAYASGVVYSKDGYVVTNDHVYADIAAPKFKIFMSDGTVYNATYVAGDARSDLAVLKIINGANLKPAIFGNSNEITVGETVVAIGRPNGADKASTISEGIISVASTRAAINSNYSNRLIQTDTATNPGSSGGALCNLYGQVVGITFAKLVGDYEGVSYAIPTTTVKKIVTSLIENKTVKNRARLGISYYDVDAVSSEVLGIPRGLKISEIDKDSDLYGKSVKIDDVITHINGQQITDDGLVLDIIEDSSAGDKVNLTIYSASNKRSFDITVKLLADEGYSSYIADENAANNKYNSSEFSFPNGE